MSESFQKILILGEEHPKVNIICDLLPPVQKASFRDLIAQNKIDVILRHCDGISRFSKSLDMIEVLSREIPYGVEIKVDYSHSIWTDKDYDQLLFIQPYPFTTEEKNSELVHLEKYLEMNKKLKITSCKIVFYHDNNQRSGSGDLDDIQNVLNKAKETLINEYKGSFKENILEYCTYRSTSDWLRIIHSSHKILSAAIELSSKKYSKWCEAIETFDIEYDLEFYTEPDYLKEEAFLRVKDFSNVNHSDNVAKKYLDNYKSFYMNKILDFADELYKTFIDEICFWDIELDLSILNKEIHSVIDKTILKNFPKKECPKTKAEYNHEILNKLNLDTKFAQAIITFIKEDLKTILLEYIYNKKEVLSSVFQEK